MPEPPPVTMATFAAKSKEKLWVMVDSVEQRFKKTSRLFCARYSLLSNQIICPPLMEIL
jgi:hypothetical protein